jgi:hypothetical protein
MKHNEMKQEPVAWRTFDGEGGYDYRSYEDNETYRDEYIARNGQKYAGWVETLYTHPQPKREWVGLTDEQADKVIEQVEDMVGNTAYAWDLVPPRSLIRAILEAAHGIKE